MKFLLLLILMSLHFLLSAQRFKQAADTIMKRRNIPEMAYAIITADSITELQVLGFHRADVQDSVTRAALSDRFHLGSNTKAITGFIAAYLVEKKKIKWNTKFFDLFPEWKQESDASYHEVTFKDLLSHRGGIRPYTSGAEYALLPVFNGGPAEKRQAFARHILRYPSPYVKSDSMHYSNAGYTIAALMMEKVSGKTWEQLVKDVLGKLDINPFFGWPNKSDTLQPYGHWLINDTLHALPGNMDYDLSLVEPAGDVSLTLPDYAKWIQYHLKGLSGKDIFLKSSTYSYLHYGIPDYSIGWQNIQDKGRQFTEHAGCAGTFFCYTMLDKKKGTAYIIIINCAHEEAQAGLFELLGKMMKADS